MNNHSTPYICSPEGEISTEGAVAQSVEQRTENPCVAGSIPAHTTRTSTAMLGFFVLVPFARIQILIIHVFLIEVP